MPFFTPVRSTPVETRLSLLAVGVEYIPLQCIPYLPSYATSGLCINFLLVQGPGFVVLDKHAVKIEMHAPYNVEDVGSVFDIISFLELERELRDKHKERYHGYWT